MHVWPCLCVNKVSYVNAKTCKDRGGKAKNKDLTLKAKAKNFGLEAKAKD
jgi:hypothetical protein